MMSLAQIDQLSNEQAVKAARAKKKPYVPFNRAEVEKYPPGSPTARFPFPNIGNYIPKGWVKLSSRSLFVDKTGWGSPNEPALTTAQLKEKLLELYDEDDSFGYAIVEEGPFQLYIGIFKEKRKK